jgi:hypothetical protein
MEALSQGFEMREFIDFNPKYCILKGNLEITGSGRSPRKRGCE